MPARPRIWRPSSNSLFLLVAIVVALSASGCADDYDGVVATLDAREAHLNNKNLEAYMALFSPEYVKADPANDIREMMTKRFAFWAAINYQSFARNVQFEGDVARVVQEYRMVLTDKRGSSQTINGADHFLLKKHGWGPFAKWLLYQGLDGAPAKKEETPAPTPTEASPAEGDQQ